jgi:hypothetical protein
VAAVAGWQEQQWGGQAVVASGAVGRSSMVVAVRAAVDIWGHLG